MPFQHRADGVTVIELLLVVVLLGVLLGLASAIWAGPVQERAYVAAMKNDLHNYALSQEAFFDAHGHYAGHPSAVVDYSTSMDVRVLSGFEAGPIWSLSVGHDRTLRQCSLTVGGDTGESGRIRCSTSEVAFGVSTPSPQPNEPVTFDASRAITEMVVAQGGLPELGTTLLAADPDDIAEIHWIFGDGTEARGPVSTHRSVEHAYTADFAGRDVVARLYLRSHDGQVVHGARRLSVRAGTDNVAPTASILVAPSRPEAERDALFDGAGSVDADGSIERWVWTFGDGESGEGPSVWHRYAVPGTYLVRLVVTDNLGLRDTAAAEFEIQPFNGQPFASFTLTPDPVGQYDTAVLDASSSSDPENGPLTYAWLIDDSIAYDGVIREHAWDLAGVRQVSLMVTDDHGHSHVATRSVEVTANIEPVADFTFSDNPVVAGDSVTLTLSATDPDGEITAIEWDLADGATALPAYQVTHAWTTAGPKNVAVVVTDDDGYTNRVVHTLMVQEPNQAPAALFTVSSNPAQEFDAVAFDASGSSDADGAIASYGWDFGDGETASGATTVHVFPGPGVYRVTLTVMDTEGEDAQTFRDVEIVENMLPVPSFTVTPNPVQAGDSAVLDASPSYDPDGEIVSWAWDLGNWAGAAGQSVRYAWPDGGLFTVRLTVTDDEGGEATVEQTVEVQTPNMGPVPVLECSRYVANPNQPIYCTAEGSYDSDGSITEIEFSYTGGGEYMPGRQNKPEDWEGHVWDESGAYTITLTVTDDAGESASITADVVIREPGICQDDDVDGDVDDDCPNPGNGKSP